MTDNNTGNLQTAVNSNIVNPACNRAANLPIPVGNQNLQDVLN